MKFVTTNFSPLFTTNGMPMGFPHMRYEDHNYIQPSTMDITPVGFLLTRFVTRSYTRLFIIRKTLTVFQLLISDEFHTAEPESIIYYLLTRFNELFLISEGDNKMNKLLFGDDVFASGNKFQRIE